MAFTTLMLFQIFNVVNARSDEQVRSFTLHKPMAVGAVAGSVACSAGVRAVSAARLWYTSA